MKCLAPEGPVYQAGTLSGNPVAMAAGLATLNILSNPAIYADLEKRSDRFIARLQKIIDGKGIQLNRCGTMFTLFFNDLPVRNFQDTKRSDQERFARYFRNMLSRGIYVSPSQFEGNFISVCHTDDVLEKVLRAIEESI
jgi:glutamate-1-semialdehyde 2,1-aminomutase